MDRNLPLVFLNLSGMHFSSKTFNMSCGISQGGILSPVLFSIYINDLIINMKLEKSNKGSHINNTFSVVFYMSTI